MLFSSATFLFAFLPVVALLYYLIPKRCTAARNLFLTGASLLFYAWGEPRFVLVMLLVIVVLFLLLFNQPFGFNAILGLIGLAGILMRNTLILTD
ncbi:MAG TPA: hypothetical protein PLL85_06280, partial [Gemmiger qucibialis]|nr:hypothetical protein [Gemmiger qucibialis]